MAFSGPGDFSTRKDFRNFAGAGGVTLVGCPPLTRSQATSGRRFAPLGGTRVSRPPPFSRLRFAWGPISPFSAGVNAALLPPLPYSNAGFDRAGSSVPLAACLAPAVRAARVPPMEALRAE